MKNARAKPGAPGAARKERREQSLRDRAASETVRNAFPTVEHIRLELTFVEATESAPAPQTFVLHPPARAYFEFPCPWSDCDGRFDLAGVARRTIERGQTQLDGTMVCTGQRARDRIPKQACNLHAGYSLTVLYSK
ncbi:MAG: hypothetical protein AB7P31_08825 [Steroidobacteraceae bacterium]